MRLTPYKETVMIRRLIIFLLSVGCAAIPEINTQEHVDGMDKLQLIFEKLEDKGKIVVIGIGKGTRMDEAIKSSSLDAKRQLKQQVELYKKCYDDSKPMMGNGNVISMTISHIRITKPNIIKYLCAFCEIPLI